MNRWQDLTDMEVNQGRCCFHQLVLLPTHAYSHHSTESLDLLAEYCSEFLIHAADVEGLCQGIDEDLVRSRLFAPNYSIVQLD